MLLRSRHHQQVTAGLGRLKWMAGNEALARMALQRGLAPALAGLLQPHQLPSACSSIADWQGPARVKHTCQSLQLCIQRQCVCLKCIWHAQLNTSHSLAWLLGTDVT